MRLNRTSPSRSVIVTRKNLVRPIQPVDHVVGQHGGAPARQVLQGRDRRVVVGTRDLELEVAAAGGEADPGVDRDLPDVSVDRDRVLGRGADETELGAGVARRDRAGPERRRPCSARAERSRRDRTRRLVVASIMGNPPGSAGVSPPSRRDARRAEVGRDPSASVRPQRNRPFGRSEGPGRPLACVGFPPHCRAQRGTRTVMSVRR